MSTSNPSAPEAPIAALPTPLDERAAVDVSALDHLVSYFAERALGGLAVLTEAGEGGFLEPAEQRLILERVLKRLPSGFPVWAQINALWTRAAADAARHAQDAGVKALLLSLPRLPEVGYPELYRYVDRIAKATELPMRLVVRPGDLVSSLAPEEQATLATHPRLGGVFVGEAGPAPLKPWLKHFEGRGDVYSACSFEFLEAAQAGAQGVVCGLAVLAPEPAKATLASVRRGDVSTARRIEKKMRAAVERLGPPRTGETQGGMERWAERIARRPLDGGRLRGLAPAGLIKEALRLQGHRIKPFVRPPQPQVTEDQRERLKVLLRACGMIG